jgi:hypothetical protein
MSNFDIKSQKILGSQAPANGAWSIPFEFEPEDAGILSARGSLYIVVNFKADTTVDLQLASKILIDAIKEHYYGDQDGTPLQALENAVSYGKDKLQETAASKNATGIKIDLVACVVWGSILYLAQFGDTTSLIIRGGEASDISHKTSGEIMTTSGILENEDVVIISTNKFEQEFNGSDLVSKLANLDSAVQGSSNAPLLSAVVIRYRKSMVPAAKDIAKIMTPFRRKNKPKKPAIEKQSAPLPTNETSLDDSKIVTSIGAPTSSISSNDSIVEQPKEENKDFQLKPESKKGRKAKQLFYGIGALLLVAGLGFGVYTFYNNFTNQSDTSDISVVVSDSYEARFELLNSSNAILSDYEALRNEVVQAVENGEMQYYDLLSQIDEKITELGGSSVNENAFYDFRAKTDNANLNKVSAFGDSILVSDSGAGQAYILTEGEEITVEDIAGSTDFLTTFSDGTNIYVVEKSKVFVGTSAENLQEYEIDEPLSSAEDAVAYFGNIYALTGTTVTKLEESGETYTATTWGDVNSGKSIAIDGSIYVLGNEFGKYYTGEKEDFALTGTEGDISGGLIYTDANSSTIYVLANNALYSFNKNSGEFSEKQDLEERVDNPTSFVLDGDTVYVTKGSALYKSGLKQEDE